MSTVVVVGVLVTILVTILEIWLLETLRRSDRKFAKEILMK